MGSFMSAGLKMDITFGNFYSRGSSEDCLKRREYSSGNITNQFLTFCTNSINTGAAPVGR